MRIAIVNSSRRKVGGVETYLSNVIPALHRGGHQLAFWHEVDLPKDRAQIELPPNIPSWCVAQIGSSRALQELRLWNPDVIYTHKIEDPILEAETIKIAP